MIDGKISIIKNYNGETAFPVTSVEAVLDGDVTVKEQLQNINKRIDDINNTNGDSSQCIGNDWGIVGLGFPKGNYPPCEHLIEEARELGYTHYVLYKETRLDVTRTGTTLVCSMQPIYFGRNLSDTKATLTNTNYADGIDVRIYRCPNIYGTWQSVVEGNYFIGVNDNEDGRNHIPTIYDWSSPVRYNSDHPSKGKVIEIVHGEEMTESITVKIKGANTENISKFMGSERELIVNTDTNTIHVQDGVTKGGHALAKKSELENLNADTVDNLHFVCLTKSEYDALETKDSNTLYFIKKGAE